jgi:hypothetical protein
MVAGGSIKLIAATASAGVALQACVDVCLCGRRLVLPTLSPEDITAIASGRHQSPVANPCSNRLLFE